MRGYAAGQNRTLDEGVLAAAMTWSKPSRDLALLPPIRIDRIAPAGNAMSL